MPQSPYQGSYCALATPFHDDDAAAIDFSAFAQLIDYQVDAGTSGLIVAGSTGEAAALGDDEFEKLVRFGVDRVAKRVIVGAGTGQSATRRTIEISRRAADAGVDFVLVVTPPYVRPTQEGLYRHFSDVADQSGVPVMLYNVPARTSCDLLPETVARLINHGNIIGIKEAFADTKRMTALLELQWPDFAIFSGDDATCAAAIARGAQGVISVSANVAPARMQELVSAATADADNWQALDASLQELHTVMGLEPNPIPVKWCLAQLGIGSARMRLPLQSLATPYHGRVAHIIESLQLTLARR